MALTQDRKYLGVVSALTAADKQVLTNLRGHCSGIHEGLKAAGLVAEQAAGGVMVLGWSRQWCATNDGGLVLDGKYLGVRKAQTSDGKLVLATWCEPCGEVPPGDVGACTCILPASMTLTFQFADSDPFVDATLTRTGSFSYAADYSCPNPENPEEPILVEDVEITCSETSGRVTGIPGPPFSAPGTFDYRSYIWTSDPFTLTGGPSVDSYTLALVVTVYDYVSGAGGGGRCIYDLYIMANGRPYMQTFAFDFSGLMFVTQLVCTGDIGGECDSVDGFATCSPNASSPNALGCDEDGGGLYIDHTCGFPTQTWRAQIYETPP